jgi:hypothetical protein
VERFYHHLVSRDFELRFVNDQLRIAPADQLTDRDRQHMAECADELKAFTAALTAGQVLALRQLDRAAHYLAAFDFETGRPRCQHCGQLAPANGCHVCERCNG